MHIQITQCLYTLKIDKIPYHLFNKIVLIFYSNGARLHICTTAARIGEMLLRNPLLSGIMLNIQTHEAVDFPSIIYA